MFASSTNGVDDQASGPWLGGLESDLRDRKGSDGQKG